MQRNIKIFRSYKPKKEIEDILNDIYGIVFEEVKVKNLKKK